MVMARPKEGRLKRDSRLQIKLYQEAVGTPCNTAIAIFLAKNWLSMSDRPEVQVITNVNAPGPMVIDEAAKARAIQRTCSLKKIYEN
jgi:hypothetical protein